MILTVFTVHKEGTGVEHGSCNVSSTKKSVETQQELWHRRWYQERTKFKRHINGCEVADEVEGT